jgi:hypothetical protein
MLSVGLSSNLLSSLFAISRTLGPELEALSILNPDERIVFLRSLQKNILNDKISGRISSGSRIYSDPFELYSYRRALSFQCRSIMSVTPILLPHSIVTGVSVSAISINLIVESCKLLWVFLGLDPEEFHFRLRKDSFISFDNFENFFSVFKEPKDDFDSCRILFFSEIKNNLLFDDFLVFKDDCIVIRTKDNLTLLEKELGFIKRDMPDFPKRVFVSDDCLKHDLIRVAIDQRKLYKTRLDIYKNFF